MIRVEAATIAPRGASRASIGPIDLMIERGERRLIVGANGAGKTTLLRLLAGLLPPRSGRIAWDGVAPGTPAAAAGSGGTTSLWPRVAALYETPDPQFLAESVASEIAFGLEGLGLSAAAVAERVAESLDGYGLRVFASRDPRTLSAGEKARALLAAALAARPECLLLDQTLAHLDPGTRRALESRLAREAEGGAYALVRTHQEAEPPFDGERLHVLDRGLLSDARAMTPEGVLSARRLPLPPALRISAVLASRGLWRGPLLFDTGTLTALLAEEGSLGTTPDPRRGREKSRPSRPNPRRPGSARDAAFALQSVTWGHRGASPLFEHLDLEGDRGEIVALVGRSGSGKSSLLRLLAGLESPRSGMAWRADRRSGRGPAAALALEYPERQLIGRTVLEDAGMALWVEGVPRGERERLAHCALSAVGLVPEKFASRVPSTLSEGEKRRVALAGLFAEPAPLLLLDEPTAGLDPEGRRALGAALGALRSRERTIVLASHDLEFVHAAADRVILLVREEGGSARVARDGDPREVFRDRAALAEAGIPAPDVVALEEALREAELLAAEAPLARNADDLVDLLARSLANRPSRGGEESGARADVEAGAA